MAFLHKDSQYYRDIMLAHYQNPNHYQLLKQKNSFCFEYVSAACVDNFVIELTCENKKIIAARFEGNGCVIAVSTIDLFCDLIINKDIEIVAKVNDNYAAMLHKQPYEQTLIADLQAFTVVLKQPHRLRCALIVHEGIKKILTIIKEKLNYVEPES